jgi:hypothetical protein
MNRLEDDLRAALRRRDPPEGFAARVLARLGPERTRRRVSLRVRSKPWIRWAAAAALALVVLAAPLAEYHRRREGEAVRNQAMLALRIASSQLNSALKKVVEMQPVRARSQGDGM